MAIIYNEDQFNNAKSRGLVDIQCSYCGSWFKDFKSQLQARIKNYKTASCSKKCSYLSQKTRVEVSCKQCSKKVFKTLSQIKKRPNNFCSRSCAATYNNKTVVCPKREAKQKFCKKCNTQIERKKTVCNNCNLSFVDWNTVTKGKLKQRNSQNYHAAIRDVARRICKDKEKKCQICGYSKHVEAAHVKPLKDFPDEATVAEINHIDNLVFLCRNCHWELDHGMAVLK